jgi:hypothetical protein
METTVITDLGSRDIPRDRRYRRTDDRPRALAFQCAHIQEALGLEAMVVSDASGDAWVGSGDRHLCRLLARSASSIASEDREAREFRLSALRSLRNDLTTAQVTTFRVPVPGRPSSIYITGVGGSRLRDHGVVTVAGGTRRILGYESAAAPAVHTEQAPDRVLQQQIDALWQTHGPQWNATTRFTAPRRRFGWTDDGAYKEAVEVLLAPALQTLTRSGVVPNDVWSGWRLRSHERSLGDGVYVRTLPVALREVRSGARLGTLHVDLYHRHDRWELVDRPIVGLQWSR